MGQRPRKQKWRFGNEEGTEGRLPSYGMESGWLGAGMGVLSISLIWLRSR